MKRRISLLLLLFVLLSSCRTTEEPPPPPPQPEAPELKEPEPVEEEPIERLLVGMTKPEVLELLPDPEEIDIQSPTYEVWSYPDHQLHFKDGLLYDWFYIEYEAK